MDVIPDNPAIQKLDQYDILIPSTALSDSFFVASALLGMLILNKRCPTALFAFFTMAVAGSLGVIRFGFYPQVRLYHSLASSFASQVGFPLLCSSYTFVDVDKAKRNHWNFLGVALAVLSSCFLLFGILIHWGVYSKAVAGLSIFLVLRVSMNRPVNFGSVASVLAIVFYILGTLVHELDFALLVSGSWLPLRADDWFHYLLCVGNILFTLGLKNLLEE